MTEFSKGDQKYDLEERTAKLAEDIIDLVKTIKITAINRRVVSQLVGCGGSLGANYCEANEAESKRDFNHKIGIVKKETKETKHWLRMLAKADESTTLDVKDLSQECQEFILIFQKSVNTLDNR